MTLRDEIVREARTWIGTPYHHQGRLKGVGVDCVGVPICVARSLGLVAPDYDVPGYAPSPDGASLRIECDRIMAPVGRDALQPGDVLVLRFAVEPQHLGIVADYLHGGLSLIHALGTVDGRGRVVEQRLDEGTLARFVAAYALPGVV